MSVLAGLEQWGHLPPGWIWLCEGEEDYQAAKSRGVTSTFAEAGILSLVEPELPDLLRGWTVCVPYSPDTAEEALLCAKALFCQSSVRLVLIPEIAESVERTFRLWLMTLSIETGCPKAGLYRAVRDVVPYFAGWEHAGRFEQVQRQELEKIRKNCESLNLNMMSDLLKKQMSALFDGLRLDTVAKSGAACCAGIQYIIEELLKLDKAGSFAEQARSAN